MPTLKRIWTIDGDQFSEEEQPTYKFTEINIYNVCLNIEAEGFCQDIYCEDITITSIKPCSAEFEVNLIEENSLMVNFTDKSITIEDDKIISWNWSFGDGNTSTEQNPTNEYFTIDNFLICLEIKTESGCQEKKCETHFIKLKKCKINIYVKEKNEHNITVFSASDWYGNPTFLWDFGDGSEMKEGHEVSHTYSKGGKYDICHTLETDEGCSDYACREVSIEHYDVDCNFTYEISDTKVQFFPNFFPYVDNMFDYGDGMSSKNAKHTYYEEGTYQVCLTQTHQKNQYTCTKCIDLVIENANYCKSEFETAIFKGNIIVFESRSEAASEIVFWGWSYGDGSGIYHQKITLHQYENSDTYKVHLYVESETDCHSYKDKYITVEEQPGCTAQIDHIINGLTANLEDISITDKEITNRQWIIGADTYSEKNISYEFEQAGEYEVCLKIQTADGCENTYCKIVNVGNDKECRADFSIDINDLTVQLSDISSGSQPVKLRHWLLGDDNNMFDASFSHTYNQPGNYLICLGIQTENDCTDFICKEVTIGNVGIANKKPVLPEGIRIYPSPAKDKISIDNQSLSSFKVILFDGMGRRIVKQKLRKRENISLDTKLMPNGLYRVQLENEKGEQWTKQVVVRH